MSGKAELHKEDLKGETEDGGDAEGGTVSLGLPVSKKHLLLLVGVVVAAVGAWKFVGRSDGGENESGKESARSVSDRLRELDEEIRESGGSGEEDMDEDRDGEGGFEEKQERAVNEMSEEVPY